MLPPISANGSTQFCANLEERTGGLSGIYFRLGTHKTKSFVNGLTYRVFNKFNNLPLFLRSIASYQLFKDRSRTYLKGLDDNFPT